MQPSIACCVRFDIHHTRDIYNIPTPSFYVVEISRSKGSNADEMQIGFRFFSADASHNSTEKSKEKKKPYIEMTNLHDVIRR